MGGTQVAAVLENVFGAVSTVVWSIHLLPQIYHTWKRGTSEGVSITLLVMWMCSGMVQCPYWLWLKLAWPLIIQAHMFTFLTGVCILQYVYYEVRPSLAHRLWWGLRGTMVHAQCVPSTLWPASTEHISDSVHGIVLLKCHQPSARGEDLPRHDLQQDSGYTRKSLPNKQAGHSVSDVCASLSDQKAGRLEHAVQFSDAGPDPDRITSRSCDLEAQSLLGAGVCQDADRVHQKHDGTPDKAFASTSNNAMKWVDVLLLSCVFAGAWAGVQWLTLRGLHQHGSTRLQLFAALSTPIVDGIAYIPQIAESMRLKSTEGLSLQFLLLDVVAAIAGIASICLKAGPFEYLPALCFVTYIIGDACLLALYWRYDAKHWSAGQPAAGYAEVSTSSGDGEAQGKEPA